MSFSKAVSSKNTSKPSLPTLPKVPSQLQSKRRTTLSNPTKVEIQMKFSAPPNEEDLDDIVNNLSTIVKRSEEVLTPVKCSQVNTVRRTSSLHINNHRNLSNSLLVKTSNSHHEQLTDSNLDLSRINPQRRSIRNLEKFSGIKCSLPSSTSTLPNTSKNLDKHCTPIHSKSTTNVSLDIPITPKQKSKSPWRLRFEKFINHQELTPITPINESVAFQTTKTISSNKEIRTPSFRLPARRTSKIHSIVKQNP